MKKVLWICNIMLPAVARQAGYPYSNREGWLTGLFEQLTKEEKKEIELGVCFPVGEKESLQKLTVNGVSCYGFCEDLNTPEVYKEELEGRFQEIFRDFVPDMIHIFGTEFSHAPAAAKAFNRPERTLIGIQGLCGEIAKVYMAGLPLWVQKKVTFRDFIRRDSLKEQQKKFVSRGENEREAIKLAGHITGRTSFDREETAKINPGAVYHPMNETMRSSFYQGQWKPKTCEKHSIFLGQGDYPLKGFHFVLEAMPLLLQKYPDAKLYVAGNSIIGYKTLKEKIKISAYGEYLRKLIAKNKLEQRVIMLGKLSEQEMKKQFLASSVFVCASVLENSPNTVGEAMLLGVPVIASEAGGIPDMITNEKDGLLFPAGDAKALAEAIERIWEAEAALSEVRQQEGKMDNLVLTLSAESRKRARSTHDGEKNYRRLLEIYHEIVK